MSTISVDALVDYITTLRQQRSSAREAVSLPDRIHVSTFGEAKFVAKPWGFELWLAHGDQLPYALKMIHIKQGTKTSLQYHREKVEHNVLFSGQLRLHYEDPRTGAIQTATYNAGSIIHVRPPAVHRVEALTDVLLVEVSSHHLDDVVRLVDDYQRPDGRIAAEHG